MKEFLQWFFNLQKLHGRPESILGLYIRNGDIKGKFAYYTLNDLIAMDHIEDVEELAQTWDGLKAVRALFYGVQILKYINNPEAVQKLMQLEIPNAEIHEMGRKLQEKWDNGGKVQFMLDNQLEEEEEDDETDYEDEESDTDSGEDDEEDGDDDE